MRIYVASSWRNASQPDVVAALRREGHEVYDFRHPGVQRPPLDDPDTKGFSWSELGFDTDWQCWGPNGHLYALQNPIAQRGFRRDHDALMWCEALVMVQPCGVSSAWEAGWAAGSGRRVYVLLAAGQEPELMVLLAHEIHAGIDTLLESLSTKGIDGGYGDGAAEGVGGGGGYGGDT